jgi:hypothetical protein
MKIIKKNMTYVVGNPGPDLGQAQKCDRLNQLVNWIPTLCMNSLYVHIISPDEGHVIHVYQ